MGRAGALTRPLHAPEESRCHFLPGRRRCPRQSGQDRVCPLRPRWASHQHSAHGPAGLSMALSDLVERFIPQSHQQPRRPPWGRQGSAKGPLRACYPQALNGATDTCPRLTGEAQANACYRAAVCLLSGSGVQHGSGGQQSQPVVTGAVPSLWPRPHVLPYPGSRPGSRGNRSDSVTRPGP